MSKYNNEKVVCDGISFASKDEMAYYEALKTRQAKGEIRGFELQIKFTLIEGFKKEKARFSCLGMGCIGWIIIIIIVIALIVLYRKFS